MADSPQSQVRRFREDDASFVQRLRHQCFSAPLDIDTWLEHGVVLDRAETPVAALLARPIGQWFGGKPVPCLTVSSVMVDLPDRGAGVLAELLVPVLDRAAAAGMAIATLVPSAAGPYRRLGFEVAGSRFRHHVSPTALRPGQPKDDVRWLRSDDGRELAAVYDRIARRNNGPIARDQSWWRTRILAESGASFGVVAERGGSITGYALWDQVSAPRAEFTFPHRIRAREIVWTTASSAYALLHALGRAGSPGEELSWIGAPSDGLSSFYDTPVLTDWAHPWMTKVLNYPVALSARGYPPPLETSLSIAIRGGQGEPETKPMSIEVRDGRCHVEQASGASDLTVDADAFAALFTGRLTAYDAHALGKLQENTAQAVDRIAAVFAGANPWLFEHF